MNPDTEGHTHAIMFHHFHNDDHPVGQGSLSANQFECMIDWLAEKYNILNPSEYYYKLQNRRLSGHDICLTFDDALLCQYEIAAPILKKRNISAYFFVYSSPFMGCPDYLEIYRYFRTVKYENIDKFYDEFFSITKSVFSTEYSIAQINYDPTQYLKEYSFYTSNDKWFRYLRDQILGKERYEEIMRIIMNKYEFDPLKAMKKLWMNNYNLESLAAEGHVIGLHSYSHPTMLHSLNKKQQMEEYEKNFQHLSEILNTNIFAMSHPCGNYNDDTLKILNSKHIQIGFRSNNSIKSINSNLEVPREDHANIMKAMNQ